MPRITIEYDGDSRRLRGESRRAQREIDRFAQGARRSFGIAAGASQRFHRALTGIAGVITIGRLFSFNDGLLQTADATRKAARNANLAFDSYQSLSNVFELAGIEQDQLAKATSNLSRNIFQLELRSRTVTEAFGRLGITFDDLEGLSLDEQFRLTLDRLRGISDETTQSAVAVQLFSRVGRELGTVLSTSAEGFRSQEDLIRRYALITTEAAEKSELFNDTLLIFRRSFSAGFINQFTTAFSDSADDLERAARAGNVLGDVLGSAAARLAEAVGEALEFIEEAVETSGQITDPRSVGTRRREQRGQRFTNQDVADALSPFNEFRLQLQREAQDLFPSTAGTRGQRKAQIDLQRAYVSSRLATLDYIEALELSTEGVDKAIEQARTGALDASAEVGESVAAAIPPEVQSRLDALRRLADPVQAAVDQYEQAIAEIESANLDAADAELLRAAATQQYADRLRAADADRIAAISAQIESERRLRIEQRQGLEEVGAEADRVRDNLQSAIEALDPRASLERQSGEIARTLIQGLADGALSPERFSELIRLNEQQFQDAVRDLEDPSREYVQRVTDFLGNALIQGADRSDILKAAALKIIGNIASALESGEDLSLGNILSFHTGTRIVPGQPGSERLARLRAGEAVLTPEQLAAGSGGGGSITVQMGDTLALGDFDYNMITAMSRNARDAAAALLPALVEYGVRVG